MSDAYKIVWWAIIFAIGMGLMITTAHADSWSTPDKKAHKIASGIATVAVYPVLRANDVEYPKATAAGIMFTAGVVKELLDPLGINSAPTKSSGKDIGANVIGISVGVAVLYVGEVIEDEYGINPFYFKW